MKRMMAMGAVLLVAGAGLAIATAGAAPVKPQPAAGAALFQARCGYCHLAGGTGTMMLERRLGKDDALLVKRTDLNAAYVKMVVRNGLNSMPALTRVEVPDDQLDRIAAYLASKKPADKAQ
ncbi:MAG TPA: cytochrome c [Sphingomonadaceae bacterium]|nr:cytochrome c [Sphingomonadaceae bacterium]